MSTLILTHGDTDGICSGALALAACPGAKVYFTRPVSVLEDAKGAADFDRTVICDVAINIATSGELKAAMDALSAVRELVYIDHHPLPEGFQAPWLIHRSDACGSLLTFQHFKDALDRDMSRVAMYGAIGDYSDSTPLALGLVRRWDKRSLYYQAGTLAQGVEMRRHDYDAKREFLVRLSKNALPSEIGDLPQLAVVASRLEDELRARVERTVVSMKHLAYVVNPEGFISKAAIYARIYGDKDVGVSAEYREGRHVYDISVRAERDYDLNQVLNAVATGHGGHGGGHPQAGGARVPAGRLDTFMTDLDEAIGEVKRKSDERIPG